MPHSGSTGGCVAKMLAGGRCVSSFSVQQVCSQIPAASSTIQGVPSEPQSDKPLANRDTTAATERLVDLHEQHQVMP